MNTYGDIGNATAGWYTRKLLSHATPVLVLEKFGHMPGALPKNETKVIQFRRTNPFEPATTPLVEGVTPDGSNFSYTTISAQIQQYGDYTRITDVVTDTSKDRVLRDIIQRQGEQIQETRELLVWDIIRAGTSVQYGGAVTSRSAVTKTSLFTTGMHRNIISHLHQAKAKMFTEMLKGSVDYETYPIEASYIVVGHTDMNPVIRDLSASNGNSRFIHVSEYGSRNTISLRELGSFEDARFVTSPDLPPHRGAGATTSGATDLAAWRNSPKPTNASEQGYDVYPLLYLGREAFGTIPLRGKDSVKPMVLQPGTPAKGDELGQRGSAGWKMWFCAKVLNEAWMRRAEVVCPVTA